MYLLMNKDKIVARYTIIKNKSEFSNEAKFRTYRRDEKMLPIGFEDFNSWLEKRKASKHNAHLKAIMHQMGCEDNLGFLRITHAASINDSFWVKEETEQISWNDISLFRNPFTDTVSRLAFEGVGLYNTEFSSTSPELSCEGSFRKCFRKEKDAGQFGSYIYIYKRGHEYSSGTEPYCEMLASEIANIISPLNSVSYKTVPLHGKTASKCNLFTNEHYGYAPFSKILNTSDLQRTLEYYESIGSEQTFREMLVIDAMTFNLDRHAGNHGVLFDNDTLNIVGMAPIFDLNLCMLPYVQIDEFSHIGDKLFEFAPKLGNDFTHIGQIAMNDVLRERVKNIVDFSFAFRGNDHFSPMRVKALEEIIRKQAEALLSNESLMTKDVFFSQNAADYERRKEQVNKAAHSLHLFVEKISELHSEDSVFSSECISTDTVQYYMELNGFELTIDFLKHCILIADDHLNSITADILEETNADVWNLYLDVKNVFDAIE